MNSAIKQYAVITASYWAFTLTDGALRMLVVLYFHQLGYSPLEIASLFLLYEFCGVITNLIGGWLATHIGLNKSMHLGLALQIIALCMMLVDSEQLSVLYVMVAQAVSGIAKDFNKMSAKSSIKLLVPKEEQGKLYQWVALLTGSKISVNLTLNLVFPRSPLNKIKLKSRTIAKAIAMMMIASLNPNWLNKKAPRKNPMPFRVFLEPVNKATH
jgi:MFS family permease